MDALIQHTSIPGIRQEIVNAISQQDSPIVELHWPMPFKTSVNEWLVGDVNEGGPGYRFSNLRGNIFHQT